MVECFPFLILHQGLHLTARCSDVMGNALSPVSVSSLTTLGCTHWVPTTCSGCSGSHGHDFAVRGNLSPESLWEEWLPVKTEVKMLLSISVCLSLASSLPALLTVGTNFLSPAFPGWHARRNLLIILYVPWPSSASAVPWPSWPHPYTMGQHP